MQRNRGAGYSQVTGVQLPAPTGNSQASITPVPADQPPSSGIYGQCMQVYTDIRTGKTPSQKIKN